ILPRHLPTEKMRVTFAAASSPRPAAMPARRGVPVDDEPHEDTDVTNLPAPQSNPVLRRGAKLSVDEERAQIEAALQACGGNQTRAAKMLGIGRRTLINRVKEFGLARPRSR